MIIFLYDIYMPQNEAQEIFFLCVSNGQKLEACENCLHLESLYFGIMLSLHLIVHTDLMIREAHHTPALSFLPALPGSYEKMYYSWLVWLGAM